LVLGEQGLLGLAVVGVEERGRDGVRGELRGHGLHHGGVLREERGFPFRVRGSLRVPGGLGPPVVGVDDDDLSADTEYGGVGGVPEVERVGVLLAVAALPVEDGGARRGE
jgi:hypothetical protein